MKLTYDKEADALYIYIGTVPSERPGTVSRTEGYWPIHFDYTKGNVLEGVEIMDASTLFSARFLDSLSWNEQSVNKNLLNQIILELEKSNVSDVEAKVQIDRLLTILRRAKI